MDGDTFGKVEQHVGPHIRQLAKDVVKENLIEEVRIGMVVHGNWNEDTFNKWKASLDDPSIALTKEEHAAKSDGYYSSSGQGMAYRPRAVAKSKGITRIQRCKCWPA